ncbi:MAG: acyl-protein synthetase [Sandaracinus sp.]|nr:acyl-protein synthetase [Myxococcales bacterium]MCB9601632.1 acyl-protein synthetase [Sandaracinus sp.]MCB9620199.1 acyl-protein synthetase [Sandaracinus sp.]
MSREALARRIADAIDAGDALAPETRDALLADLRAYQAAHVVPYGRLVRGRGPDAAMPTDVFRFARVASHPDTDDVRVFRTSGTTSGARGEHPFADLSLYDRAAKAWASRMLFPEGSMRLVVLAPHEDDAPDSSLSYMLSRFETWFGTETTFCWKDGVLDVDALRHALRTDEPVALLGTSFAFVFAEDALAAEDTRFTLAPGSRVMQTGGFKGRTREIAPAAMLSMLAARFGVGEDRVVAEYGMTELSSQAYETTLVAPTAPRQLRFPAWVRVTAVDPVSLEPLPTGETGLLRIDDAANLDSVCALQTADLARVHADGSFELFGRAPGATPRGCSLAVEEALA